MIKVTNKMRGPVQLVIKTKTKSIGFTCLNIPGRGAGKNVYYLEDELMTEYVDRLKKSGLIDTKYIPASEIARGE